MKSQATPEKAMALRVEGLSYAEIGAKLGVSKQRIHYLLRPHMDVLESILRANRNSVATKKALREFEVRMKKERDSK